MEQLATGGVPVLESSIRIYSDDYVFGDGVAGSWSPSQLGGRHWLLHLGVQGVGLLSGVHIIDFHTSIVATLGEVFVMWIEPDTECLVLKRSQGVLMGNLYI